MVGQHSLNYPPSFLSHYLKRLVISLVYLPYTEILVQQDGSFLPSLYLSPSLYSFFLGARGLRVWNPKIWRWGNIYLFFLVRNLCISMLKMLLGYENFHTQSILNLDMYYVSYVSYGAECNMRYIENKINEKNITQPLPEWLHIWSLCTYSPYEILQNSVRVSITNSYKKSQKDFSLTFFIFFIFE